MMIQIMLIKLHTSAVTSFLKKSNKGTVDANTAATPRKDAQDPSSSTPSRQRNTPSKKIPEFETLDPDFIGEQSAVKVAKRKAPPHADEDRFKKGGSLGSQTGPSTINKKPNTGDAELDAGISELVQGLKNTKPSKQQATKQLYALAQHDLTSHQQRLKGPQSSPATRRSPVKAPHSEESSVNPREVLAQLGRVLRPYIFTPDKSLLLADSNTYANFSIDDEISNTLDNLAGSFTAEAFLANAKILKKVVRHHTSVLKEQGSVVSRHGKRIAITEGQIDMLTARVDLLEQQQKEGGTKKQGIVFD